MTRALEHFGSNIVDEQGNVLPAADVTEGTIPPDSAFIIGRDYTLPTRRAREQELDAMAQFDAIEDKNPGVHVSLAQRYRDELELLDIISGANMREGFDKAKDYDTDIHERYGDNLPQVAIGAHRNHVGLVNRDILDVYHAEELKSYRDGNGSVINHPEEIDFDARTIMRNEYNKEYGGVENKNKRARRRKWLKEKLAEYATKDAA